MKDSSELKETLKKLKNAKEKLQKNRDKLHKRNKDLKKLAKNLEKLKSMFSTGKSNKKDGKSQKSPEKTVETLNEKIEKIKKKKSETNQSTPKSEHKTKKEQRPCSKIDTGKAELGELPSKVTETRWNDIGGLEKEIKQVREIVELPLKNPESFNRLGIEPPKGLLLYGPPGTGKTLLAKAVATESEASFISIKGPEFLSKWVGESEKAVRETFKKAKQVKPAIIFFDEIDAIVSKRGRGNGSSRVVERVISQLLTEMDGLEELEGIMTIGATNRPDLVDPALLRPGRFDRIVQVSPPGEEARYEIFKVHTREMSIGSNVSLKKLAKETENYSGADIAAVCKEAAMIALRQNVKAENVKMEHFEKALNIVGNSISETDLEKYERFREEHGGKTNSNDSRETKVYY